MKEIKAVIQPKRLAKLREAFRAMPGFPGMTVTQAEGCSSMHSATRPTSIRGELVTFSPKMRIEIVAPDEMVEAIVKVIHEQAHTGNSGDGLVWVTNIDSAAWLRNEPE